MMDHKDHRRRLVAKNDISTLSSATNTCTYTTPDLREMIHGIATGRGLRRTLGMLVVKESKIQDREAGQGNNKHVLCILAPSTMKMRILCTLCRFPE